MSVSIKTRLRVNILIYLTTSIFHSIVFFTSLLSFELYLDLVNGGFSSLLFGLCKKNKQTCQCWLERSASTELIQCFIYVCVHTSLLTRIMLKVTCSNRVQLISSERSGYWLNHLRTYLWSRATKPNAGGCVYRYIFLGLLTKSACLYSKSTVLMWLKCPENMSRWWSRPALKTF